MRDLILGTAGHIDHGKTALVRALTGVDCDRLPEEKARGITIDIGFARLELAGVSFGVVDCPGHERFVKNMLAGSTAIDAVLLVVAADDGIMPQTREHLDILRLLGVRRGVVALTKCDLVPISRREQVAAEIRDLLKETPLANAAIVETSVVAGTGLDELRASLIAVVVGLERRQDNDWFRLSIDRAFTVPGHGTVVTGSVLSGQVAVGDGLEWLPSGRQVRVRGVQNHDTPSADVHAGQRAAINLAGVAVDEVERGQELAEHGYLVPSTLLTVRLEALGDNRRPIRHRLEARLHLGTAEVMATVSLLDTDELRPGESAYAQLFLGGPVTATHGQPFVLRESSAQSTLGGGTVLQAVAAKIKRRQSETMARLERLSTGELPERIEEAVWFAGFVPVTRPALVRDVGTSAIDGAIKELRQVGRLCLAAEGWLHPARVADLEARLMGALEERHRSDPLATSHDRSAVVRQLSEIAEESLVQEVVDDLIAAKRIVGDARRLAAADFRPRLTANQQALKDRLVEGVRLGRFQPPETMAFGGDVAEVAAIAVAEGTLVRITETIYLHVDTMAELTTILREKMVAGPATVSQIREWLGTTRKYAVPICEHLDRTGVTRRVGDHRWLN